MTAIAYMRKSVVQADDPKNSAEAQEAAVRAMATRYGENGSLVILADWDKSGKLGRAKRPGYDALWSAIEDGSCSAVYSYSMSRLARSVSELVRLFEACQERHIPVRLEADSIDTSTASGRMTAVVLAAVAAFEADVAGERMKAALGAKRARGERLGARNYGEGPEDDAEAVLRAFREAGSYNGAARILNEAKVPTRNSKVGTWWPASVAKVVHRLDPEQPFRVQKGAAAGRHDSILARLLICPTCGMVLTPSRWKGRTKYMCSRGNSLRPHPRSAITEASILPAIRAEVAHLRTPETVLISEESRVERARLEAKRLRVIENYQDGVITKAERNASLQAVLEALAKAESKAQMVALPSSVDWTAEPRKLNRFLRALFSQVHLDPETFMPTQFDWAVEEWRA